MVLKKSAGLFAATLVLLSIPTNQPRGPVNLRGQRNVRIAPVVQTSVGSAAESVEQVWLDLADCESGDWRNGTPVPDTRRWDYGLEFDHGDIFEGGLNFHPQTWDSYRPEGFPEHAGQATREQEIQVAKQVLEDQGPQAWPVCSKKVGLHEH